MRFDTPVYFQQVMPGEYDESTGNYGDDIINEELVYARVNNTGTETLNLIYGEIRQDSLIIKLQMPYTAAFDRIKVGDKFYKVDSVKQLKNIQVYVVSELQCNSEINGGEEPAETV